MDEDLVGPVDAVDAIDPGHRDRGHQRPRVLGQSTHLSDMSASDRATLDVTFNSLSGLTLGQLAIAVLGVLVVTTEYSTGGVKATYTAVPDRLRVLLAKGIVFAVIATIVGIITSFAAFYAAQPFWAHQHLAAHIGDPGRAAGRHRCGPLRAR